MEQEVLDRMQELKKQYAEQQERLEGWEVRIRALAEAISDLHATLLREASRRTA
jgi:hypothetical protein